MSKPNNMSNIKTWEQRSQEGMLSETWYLPGVYKDQEIKDLRQAVLDHEKNWLALEKAIRSGCIPGAGYGHQFKIISICPTTGDEHEFLGFLQAIKDAN